MSAVAKARWALGVLLSVAVCLPITSGMAEARELRAAAARGDIASVRTLVAEKRDVDARDQQGQTALLLAVAAGHTEVAKALIDAGASIDAVAVNKDTPWLLAGARGRTEILRHMWPKGPDLGLRNRYGGTALIPACHYDHVETVAFLLTTRIDVNHVNGLGWTCLLEIVILTDGGRRAQANTRQVLEAGADPNIADRDGITALGHARKRGFDEIARLIAARGGK